MIHKSRKAYLRNLNPSNKKLFWKSIKCLSKQKSAIPTPSLNDTFASTDSAKATMLNFSSCFSTAVPPLSRQSHPQLLSRWLLCTEDVATLICSLDTSNANGPDGVAARMLKGTLNSIVPSLTKLFNISITTGQSPQCWKESVVVPIPKGGHYSKPTTIDLSLFCQLPASYLSAISAGL